jgi:hypothetical protein
MKFFRSLPNNLPQLVFFDHDKIKVFHWLMANMMDDCVLYMDTLSAVDDLDNYRWRLGSDMSGRCVLLYREEDVVIFQLAWGS